MIPGKQNHRYLAKMNDGRLNGLYIDLSMNSDILADPWAISCLIAFLSAKCKKTVALYFLKEHSMMVKNAPFKDFSLIVAKARCYPAKKIPVFEKIES